MSVIVLQGTSQGIGYALLKQFLTRSSYQILATCRNPDVPLQKLQAENINIGNLTLVKLDLLDKESIKKAAGITKDKFGKGSVKLILNSSGILKNPEKSIKQIEEELMIEHFKVNCLGPSLVYKEFLPLMKFSPGFSENAESSQSSSSKQDELIQLPNFPVLASISARVGSISDNRLGGWYSYRTSKAALNMMTKTLAQELNNKNQYGCAIALHPGTVESNLSKNFLANQPKHKIFSPDQSANYLIKVLTNLRGEDNGNVFAYDGTKIPY